MRAFDQGYFPTSVFVYDSTNISALFSRTVYWKGAWVLHMLRFVMGDEAFFQTLKNYVEAFAFSTAITEDFQKLCEAEYDKKLDWFFKQWVYGLFRPRYEYSWHDSTNGEEHLVTLKIKQIQTDTDLFKMPLEIVIHTTVGESKFVVWDSLASQKFQFVLNDEVTNLKIDPDDWVLKYLKLEEELQQLSYFQNFPNPFNLATIIRYRLPYKGRVMLDIYNIMGQKIVRLVDEVQFANQYYRVRWDGQDELKTNTVWLYEKNDQAEVGF
jgi:aminopeptidase N